MVAILNGASRLKFVAARRAAPTLGFSIRGDLLYLRVNLFHSAAVGILFEGSAVNGEWASAVAGLIFRRNGARGKSDREGYPNPSRTRKSLGVVTKTP
jgi:hypothetical protein